MFTSDDMDLVFTALSHATRRRILDIVKTKPGCSVGQLANEFDVSRIAVMNHLGILERAELITSAREGRTRRLYLNAIPIQMIHQRWLDQYSMNFADQMLGIKSAAENRSKQSKNKGE